jgi:adenine-specific DNA-methyltransferase
VPKVDYDQLSREELVRLHHARDGQRRLGLVWERDEIEQERARNDDLVLVAHDQALSLGPESKNLIIEGDNFDALRFLRLTHRRRVKCILIDPPYNTGKKDWVYNDRFVDKEDRFRESQWLEFLYQRLTLARDLLRDDGVILVCINDENRSKLELLLDHVFPGKRVGSFVWKTRAGTNDPGDHFFSSDHEHVLVYGMPGFRFSGEEKSGQHYRYDDNDGRGKWMSGDLTVAVKYDDPRAGNAYYPLYNPETDIWYPCDPDQVWRYASRKKLKPGQRLKTKPMEEWIEDRKISFPSDDRVSVWNSREELLAAIDAGDVPNSNGRPLLRRGLPELETWLGRRVGWGKPRFKRHWRDLKHEAKPVTSWIVPKADPEDKGIEGCFSLTSPYTNEGTSKLLDIFKEKVFNYPKPVTLIAALLNQVTGPEDIILDFFAGSGTTAHAVLQLNAEDAGNRRFIMVSSTEATLKEPQKNICRDVCAERIRRVIEQEGYEDGFAYLRTVRVPVEDLDYDLTPELVAPTILLRHWLPLQPWSGDGGFGYVQRGDQAVMLIDTLSEEAIAAARRIAESSLAFTVYTWRPAALADIAFPKTVQIIELPDNLARSFAQ